MNNELLAKARKAGSPEELLKVVKENGMPTLTGKKPVLRLCISRGA